MSSFRKASSNKWKRYNAWRARNRAIDQSRRLERIAEKKAAYAESYVVPKAKTPRAAKAWARVRIHFADGTGAGFSIHETPWGGLNVSATLAGRRVAEVLKAAGGDL